MEERLWKIFNNVNRWLEFAEKKNALMMTFIGVQLGVSKYIVKEPGIVMKIGIGFLLFGFLVTVSSFLPKIKISKRRRRKRRGIGNLIYFGDIAGYSIEDYIEALETAYKGTIKGNKINKDLADEIVINSRIASRKYNCFKLAVRFLLIGQILFFGAYLIQHFFKS